MEVNIIVSGFDKSSMLELFVFEILDLLSQLENVILNSEEKNAIEAQINEIFRIIHTIKGSASMMGYSNISSLSHSLEDAFYYLRENPPSNINYSTLADIVLESTDFIKNEISKIQSGEKTYGDASTIIQKIKKFLPSLKNKKEKDNRNLSDYKKKDIAFDLHDVDDIQDVQEVQEDIEEHKLTGKTIYKALIFFEDGCEMENIRAFNVMHNLEKVADIISYYPSDIIENQESAQIIQKKGFEIQFSTDLCVDDVKALLSNTLFMKDIKLEVIDSTKSNYFIQEKNKISKDSNLLTVKQSMISVNVSILDTLMDLVGELVIAQSMVIQNPELEGIPLNSFNKASRQLQKVTNELQDAIMSVRMVPISITFQKMHRIVRDMGKKLNKEVELEIIGEETEVDKNIIEHLSDPLIHLVRNAMDHGIESVEERDKNGKSPIGKITLKARNEGGDVWIIIKDDGRGLDKNSILAKAKQLGLLNKSEDELTDQEIYSCILKAGFTTKEEVSEFSGRGVGMDVVNKNIEEVGGIIHVDSSLGVGTSISIKIPLTLAIIDGMKVRVGKSVFIIPITSIRESFRVQNSIVLNNEDGNSEMIMFRGNCCSVLRLHEFFDIQPDTTNLEEGIIIAIENGSEVICLFADELLGGQQVVVKPIPKYVKKVRGVSGCTVMGDGRVSLIIDTAELINSL
jgi:two-component system chemotaxis sensor kinase CheA